MWSADMRSVKGKIYDDLNKTQEEVLKRQRAMAKEEGRRGTSSGKWE